MRKDGRSWLLALMLASGSQLSCGYRAVYGGERPDRLHVGLVRTLVADAVASEEVLSGLREELARGGALQPGDGWPRAEVEVLRADEESEGIVASAGRPIARGTEVALVARAWISSAPGAAPEHDTGDMRAAEVVTADVVPGVVDTLDPEASGFHHHDALRAAARRLGQKLARKLMGRPASSEDEGVLDR